VLVAHFPAGFIVTRFVAKNTSAWLLALGLGASALPDIDLLRFFLVDHRAVLHHAYWTHTPFWWALAALAWFGVIRLLGLRSGVVPGAIIFANLFSHLVLDTVVGGIRWLAPVSDRSFILVTVPARFDWWIWNFLLHWTFLLELGIVACAARMALAGAPCTGAATHRLEAAAHLSARDATREP